MKLTEAVKGQALVANFADAVEMAHWNGDRNQYCLTIHWRRGGKRLFHNFETLAEAVEEMQAKEFNHPLVAKYVERFRRYRDRNDVESARRQRHECCVVYALVSEEQFDRLTDL